MTVEENIPLAPFTTLRIGGPARFFARIASEDDLLEAIRFARSRRLPIFTLGGGSNLVVPDHGFPGLVIKIALGNYLASTDDWSYVEASAGLDWDEFVLAVCAQGISGVECLAGIPGLLGGAPVQNIGAYGQEVSQTIISVRALDLDARKLDEFAFRESLPAQECKFTYRSSIFNTTQRNRYIITRVDFKFDPSAQPNLTYADLRNHFPPSANPTPLDVYYAVRAIRDRKGMLIADAANPTPDSRSAGSFFKNPVVPASSLNSIATTLAIPKSEIPNWSAGHDAVKLPAAWLIERAGFPKGFALSPASHAAISTRHTLALTNRSGHATCADLLALRDHIAAEVHRRFRIPLEQEPVTLP